MHNRLRGAIVGNIVQHMRIASRSLEENFLLRFPGIERELARN
jgi:hypothetical protein